MPEPIQQPYNDPAAPPTTYPTIQPEQPIATEQPYYPPAAPTDNRKLFIIGGAVLAVIIIAAVIIFAVLGTGKPRENSTSGTAQEEATSELMSGEKINEIRDSVMREWNCVRDSGDGSDIISDDLALTMQFNKDWTYSIFETANRDIGYKGTYGILAITPIYDFGDEKAREKYSQPNEMNVFVDFQELQAIQEGGVVDDVDLSVMAMSIYARSDFKIQKTEDGDVLTANVLSSQVKCNAV
jgi:hypothetical protein